MIPASGHNRLIALAADIRQAHQEVQQGALAVAERTLAAGHALLEAKSLVRHGAWNTWLRDNCGLSERSAQRYMQLARAGVKPATVAFLGLRGASESIARRAPQQDDVATRNPPGRGEVLLVERRPPQPGDELFAYIWPSQRRRRFYELVAFDAEWSGGGSKGGGSVTTLRRPVAWEEVPASLFCVGLHADDPAVRTKTFQVDPGKIEDLRRAAVGAAQ
jgi:hypothetical protein